jgi:hypothetical protein
MLKELQEQVGKKLLWVGYDEKDELYTMVFEGNVVFRLPEFAPLANGKNFIETYLGERLADAKSIVNLESILLSEPVKPENVVVGPLTAVHPVELNSIPATQGVVNVGQQTAPQTTTDVAPPGESPGTQA